MEKPNTNQRKKVIHVVQHLAPGGLETLTLDLLRLAKPLDQVLIVSLEGTKDKAIKNQKELIENEKKSPYRARRMAFKKQQTSKTSSPCFKSRSTDISCRRDPCL